MEAKILNSLIQKSGLSQRDFAAKFDLPEQRVSGWLNGVRNIKMSTLKKMAEELGFEIVLSFEVRKS
ncbi:helix-turn-helix domain-containing protein [Flavobacterium johnsoniae]|uniref:Helix-turn-helix n=1 Tax=Flavobacterium johnsoniae TaxID=986 RepID=A0A1M5IH10_FLAJO|nr:helix-turn-helix transcriptional regulator [Flavobacterium johnsoniae]SHG27210.1 Helix-turn-helix [Flavobacterium johnsoniae]